MPPAGTAEGQDIGVSKAHFGTATESAIAPRQVFRAVLLTEVIGPSISIEREVLSNPVGGIDAQ
jgi:hypothetical protein